MKYLTKSGQELHPRRLSNEEYDRAAALANYSGIPLYQCPTCKAKPEEIPDSGGVMDLVGNGYRYLGEEHDCDCRVQQALRLHYLVANIGDQYQRLDWANFGGTTKAVEMVTEYLDSWQDFRNHGYGVEFGGPLGVGKTFAATHIGKELIKRGQQVYFVPFIEMVRSFEEQNGDEIEARIRETTYIILDEIEPAISERQREFFATKFEAAIRHRTNHNLPTIITTNMSENDLHEDYPRTYSLLAAKQIRVNMGGEDARRHKIGEENLELIANGEVRPIT